MRMWLARLLVVMATLTVALVAAPPAHAVSFVLDDFHSVVQGGTVDFFATLTRDASDPDPLYLDGLNVSVAGLTVNDAPFFSNFPAFFGGFTPEGPKVMFTLTASSSLLPGFYGGTATLSASDGDGGEFQEATQDFRVEVLSSTEPIPEPTTMTLLGLGLAGTALRRRRKAHI